MNNYVIVGGELYHYGVKGMKWGVRKAQPQSYLDRKKSAYKTAKKEYNKSFNKAYNRAAAAYSPFKKHRQANDARWEDAANKAESLNKAKSDYKSAKKAAKAQKKWEKNVNKNWSEAYNRAADTVNSRIEAFNAKYKNIDRDKNPKQYRKYIEDYCNMWNGIYTKELESTFGKAPIDKGRKWCDTVPMFMDPADQY